MSAEENKALARRAWEALDNPDLIDELYASDVVWHEPDRDIHGTQEAKQFISLYKSAFPDMNVTVEDVVAEGDKVVTRVSIRGTHQGETEEFLGDMHKDAARGKMGRGRRRKAQPTDEWQELLPLFEWPEQRAYEELRPLVLFGSSVAERARETGTPERTMYRSVERFKEDGMLSLFATDPATARARHRGLEPAIQRMIVELKAEHPRLNANEIANIVYVRTGRRLGKHTPARILAEEVVPLKLSRLFEPYHETMDVREAREAVVAFHLDGWSVKAIASYMRVSRTTVYRILGRWIEEGDAGLDDRQPGRPRGVRKVDLATMDFIRRSQENPELGAFRVHAALVQKREPR